MKESANTATRARPELWIRIPLEGRAEVTTSATTEGDYYRLTTWLERSPAGRRLLATLDDLREEGLA